MNVSAVNCTPIKPQVSFGNLDDDNKFERYQEFADKVDDEFVKSSTIKKPIAAVISVLLAGLIAYGGGKRIAQIAINGGEKLKLNFPEMLDKSLRTVSKKATEIAGKLKNDNPVTKSDKVKNILGSAIGSAEKAAKSLYKKMAYSGVNVADDIAVKQAKAFANVGGMAGVATGFSYVVSKDSNDDGVADILQRGQNAYTGAKTKMGQLMEKAGKISELVDLLT